MHPFNQFSGSQPYCLQPVSNLSSQPALSHWFHTIPPERLGLNGEYDHDGLAKRVAIAFRKSLAAHIVSTISVSQRGAVVVLRGGVPNSETLQLLVDVAMQVDGASGVEINGVTYFSPMDLRFANQRRVRSLAC